MTAEYFPDLECEIVEPGIWGAAALPGRHGKAAEGRVCALPN